MRADLIAAIRSLCSSKAFTAVSVIVLTLGIGASTAVFSVVDAVLLRGLPFDEHDRLVAVGERRPPGPTADPNRDPQALLAVAPQNHLDWAARQQVFESFAAIAGGAFTLREPGAEPEDLRAQRVTAGFFDALRAHPPSGARSPRRTKSKADIASQCSATLSGAGVGGNPEIVGSTIPLEGGSYEVVGIMPPDVTYPVGVLRPTDLWVPYVVPPDERTRIPNTFSLYLQAIARLKPGVSVAQARAQMDQIAAALTKAHPEWNKNSSVGVLPLRDHVVGARIQSWMLMLLGAVSLVLLIACANVASLLLARATAREREIGIRAALGAGRWRLIRQLLVESLVLSIAGTCLAIVLAWWAIHVLKISMPEGVPRVAAIALDLRVLAAAAGASLATAILFGIVPALHVSKPDLTHALKEGARGSVGVGRQRLRQALVVAEVALAVVLLVGAGLFIDSFIALMRIHPGFDPAHVLIAQVSPRSEPGSPPLDRRTAYTQIVERISQAPGVLHASMILGGTPLSGSMSTTALTVPGGKKLNDETVSVRRVTPEYHRALRIPLRGGRLFEPGDRQGTTNVAIISESAAGKHFPGENPLGRVITLNRDERTIVGIVGDVYQTSLETPSRPEAYVPLAQGSLGSGELVIRTSGDPYDVLPAVKTAIFQVLPDVPLRNVRTMEEAMSRRVAQRRLNMLLLGLFGLLGLVISAVGVYGVMACVVSQRTREIGVRMALGATRAGVVAMVLKNACALVGLGLVLGGGGAWYLSATAKTFLFGLEPNDPRAFIVALASLSVAALTASVIPARRAASVDPMVALRAE